MSTMFAGARSCSMSSSGGRPFAGRTTIKFTTIQNKLVPLGSLPPKGNGCREIKLWLSVILISIGLLILSILISINE
jgi:hypothetical protein